MIDILRQRNYLYLFSAQVVALIGTGLLTVALSLLAFDLAGEQAGAVLGTAFAIKMLAYVGLSPVATAVTMNCSRKTVLVAADLVRVSVALLLPLIDSVWQIYILIFVLQTASATFTPTFQSIIPDLFEDEHDYTKALSLSRLAYDLENLLSPLLAGALLLFVSYKGLFVGTGVGFIASGLLVLLATIPVLARKKTMSFRERITRGSRIYLATPRLRGLLALNFAAAMIGSYVLVNTVVVARSIYSFGDSEVAQALAFFGAGSMFAALALPKLLEKQKDRTIMMLSGLFLSVLSLLISIYSLIDSFPKWFVLLLVWLGFGVFYSAILTPAGRLLKTSSHPEDRTAIFSAQFALSHLCWLLGYPLAGWLGDLFGLSTVLVALGGMSLAAVVLAHIVWPASQQDVLEHTHENLPEDHPHLKEHQSQDGRHRHIYVIDDHHHHWPVR